MMDYFGVIPPQDECCRTSESDIKRGTLVTAEACRKIGSEYISIYVK